MNRALWIVGAAVTGFIAFGVWTWLEGTADLEVPTTPTLTTPATVDTASVTPANATDRTNSPPIERTTAPAPTRAPTPAAHFPQGLRGLLLDESSRALAGLSVYLVDSAGNDPLAIPLLTRQRDAFSPVASAESAVDGTFALGLPVAQDKIYEVYVLSPTHATARLGGLRLLAGQWHDLGAITLTAGATLRGRVTVVGREDIPIVGAVVAVEIGGTFADAALRALPGAGHGLVATADVTGAYELRHVPSRGIVQVAAVAPGFARLLKQNIELSTERAVEVNFGLAPGHSLSGTIVDVAGGPISNARVEAWPQQPASGPLLAQSDDRGQFTVLGLLTGPHRLRVQTKGFAPHDELNVMPDRTDLRIVMQQQSRIRVRVVSDNGNTLRSYQIGLRRYFPEQNGQIASVAEVPEQRVRLDGLTDTIELTGVPTGRFVCQVEAEGFAKSLSPEIDNVRETGADPGPREFDIVVTMHRGGVLRGRVLDETGAPIVGANISTQANGTMPDSPFFRMLAGSVPDRITVTKTTTDRDGQFVLPTLALADYQLLVEHPEACRTFVRGLRIERPVEVIVPPIRLFGGATIRGRATIAGRVVGQIKVVLSTPSTQTNATDAVRLETVTDAEGAFLMPRRVPPGTYELRAAVVGTAEPEAQIFRQIFQLQRSSTLVSVAPGQRQVERDIDLPSDH